MRTKTKVWLIIAASLVLIGCVVFGGAMSMIQWDFTKLSTAAYESNTYEISENYKNISVITNTADIVFVPSESLVTSVSCYERKNMKHAVTVHNGKLAIEIVDTREWYEHIGINFDTSKITVSIPQGEYSALSVKSNTGNVEIPKDFGFESIDISVSTGEVTNYASTSEVMKIKTNTGNIRVENISAGALDLSVSTGKVTVSGVTCEGDVTVGVSTGKAYLTDTKCKSVISSGNTGDITLDHVIAAEKFSIERSTGDIKLDRCDAAEIYVKTDTGDVAGSLLSDKVFITETDTGSINVPNSITGGRCEITTATGDVKIGIAP